jgi:hypothetical protein
MVQAKSLHELYDSLDKQKVTIEQLGDASWAICDCLLEVFGVPEGNESETMIKTKKGKLKFLPNHFSRDNVRNLFYEYTDGEMDIDELYEYFKEYMVMVAKYLAEFPVKK